MTDRRVRPSDRDGRAPLRRSQLPARNARLVAKGAQNLADLEGRQPAKARDLISRRFSPLALDRPEQPRHAVQRLRLRSFEVVEKPEERVRSPLRRKSEQIEKIPKLDGMNLHRRRRQQDQARSPAPEIAHQLQQRVGTAFAGGSRPSAAGVVGFVEHHEIPTLRVFQESRRPVSAPHEMARRDHDRFPVPCGGVAFMASVQRRRGITDHSAAVVDRPVEVELLAKFDLPLPEHRFRRQYQDALRPPGEPCLPQQQAGLDGLAEPHLVGDEEFRGPALVEPSERPQLMRPRGHRGRGLADEGAALLQCRRFRYERPDQIPPIIDRRRRIRRASLPFLQARRQIVLGQKAQQIPSRSLGYVQDDHVARPIRPQAREVLVFMGDPLRFRAPTRVDVDAFPIAPPSGFRLVQASVPRQAVPVRVLDDARLFVKQPVVRRRSAAFVARHRDLHVEMPFGHHPCEQFERIAGRGVQRLQGRRGEAFPDPLAKILAASDRVDFPLVEGAADEQPHPAAVSHEALDAARRKRQRGSVEKARQPVVAHRLEQRRNVESGDEIAVFGGVFEFPAAVAQHGQSPRQSSIWSGSPISSR